jgi:hypothetical protein
MAARFVVPEFRLTQGRGNRAPIACAIKQKSAALTANSPKRN